MKLTPFNAADYLNTPEAWAAFEQDMRDAPKAPLDENWMRVGPNTDAAIWRPWGRETGEL